MFAQTLMIAYLIKFRPFRSELQQIIIVSDEFTIIFGICLLYFLWKNQHNIVKSNRIGLGIITVIVLSMVKNMTVIIILSIRNVYTKFRTWVHKKLDVAKYKRNQRRIERRKRREQLEEVKNENKKVTKTFLGDLRPEQIWIPGKLSVKNHMRRVDRPSPTINQARTPEPPKDRRMFFQDHLLPSGKSIRVRNNSVKLPKKPKIRKMVDLSHEEHKARTNKQLRLDTIDEEHEDDEIKASLPRIRSSSK